jgi:putative transposase
MFAIDITGSVSREQGVYRQKTHAPDLLHYVSARGVAGTDLFGDDEDRESFLERLASILEDTQTQCHAWALVPDQFHLLLRTHAAPLSKVMQRLMTGYAVTFNRRHQRSGYLFENRYKSISYENDGCLWDLIRYIHQIPLQAKVVRNIQDLYHYPWAGPSAARCTVLQARHAINPVSSWKPAPSCPRPPRLARLAGERAWQGGPCEDNKMPSVITKTSRAIA